MTLIDVVVNNAGMGVYGALELALEETIFHGIHNGSSTWLLV